MSTTIPTARKHNRTAYHFFLSHAGYSYDPKTQTRMQGRIACARHLAYAEERAKRYGCSFAWEIDQDIDSSEWSDDPEPWHTWSCIARDANGKVFASLCGIDFGRDGQPWGEPYRRVVEAELADELPSQDDDE